MQGKERRVSARSLENLKLGAIARYQGKIRQNVTIKPDSLEWLKKGGNVSGRIDELVARAKSGELNSNNTHSTIDERQQVSSYALDLKLVAQTAELEQQRKLIAALEEKLEQCEQKVQQSQQQPNLEVIRERILSGLRVGKQAPEYKRTKSVIDKFIAQVLEQ
jgi:hypothetical protein